MLRVFRLCREGREGDAIVLASDFERTRDSVIGMSIDRDALGRILQDHLGRCVTCDLAALEKAKLPEFIKTAKRQRIQLRAEPFRSRRKRVTLDAIYSENGEPITDDAEVAGAIAQQWAPYFAEREVDEAAMAEFAQHIRPGAGRTEWTWPSGTIRATAAALPTSAPGPDGLPYLFWVVAPAVAIDMLEDIARGMSAGRAPPSELLDSLTLFIPKGEYAEDIDRLIRTIVDLRPMTLMQTSAKVVASVANLELSTIAKTTVAGEQRGFIEGRNITDNVLEIEGSLFEFSQLLDALPAIILYDFAQAFPSLAHRWIWLVLEALDVHPRLRALVRCLYTDLQTSVFHAGRRMNTFRILAGIKQGCPMSGSIFALCADPLIRAHLLHLRRHRWRVNLFADDVAIALLHLEHAFPGLMSIFRRLHKATGLGLKLQKCSIIMGTQEIQRYRVFFASCPDAQLMRLVDAATYLGIQVGPGGPRQQWAPVAAKVVRRMPDVLAAPSMMGRMLRFNTYVASLFHYKLQFASPSSEIRTVYRHAEQKLVKAPWMAFPPDIVENMKYLHFPLEARPLHLLERQAQVGVLLRSTVWNNVLSRIDVARDSEEARLDPRQPWHDTSIIATLTAGFSRFPGNSKKQLTRALSS